MHIEVTNSARLLEGTSVFYSLLKRSLSWGGLLNPEKIHMLQHIPHPNEFDRNARVIQFGPGWGGPLLQHAIHVVFTSSLAIWPWPRRILTACLLSRSAETRFFRTLKKFRSAQNLVKRKISETSTLDLDWPGVTKEQTPACGACLLTRCLDTE